MKTIVLALIAVLVLGFGSIALAGGAQGPVLMTDAQMDNVIAGKDRIYSYNLTYTFGDGEGIYEEMVPNKLCARPTTQINTSSKNAKFTPFPG